MTTYQLNSINIGIPMTMIHEGKEIKTSLFKKPVHEALFLHKDHFQGDEQADLINHGGEDKAVCVYPFEHYAHWEKILNTKLEYGAFGENLTISGLVELDVCLGDTFQIGEVIVQISQPRMPCYKLAARYNTPELPKLVQNTGYTGFYFRVLKEGIIERNATIELLENHSQKISINDVNHVMYHDKDNIKAIEKILKVEALSSSWRKMFLKRLEE